MKVIGRVILNFLLIVPGVCILGSSLYSTFPNQTTKDLDVVHPKYDTMFDNAAMETNTPLNGYEAKNPHGRMKDNHDPAPKFAQESYRTSILETCQLNTTILKVEAKDRRTYLIKYKLSGPHHEYFHINSMNGDITLAKGLEYNRINRYSLNASAEDPLGFSSTVPVLIDIQDVDTMNPHFMFPMYQGSISENQKGNISTQPEAVQAIDGDLGINETVYYSINHVFPSEYRNITSIDSSTGIISLNKEVDREKVSLLIVEIKATQQNNPLKSADSVVVVTILDENDNAPQFSQSIYEADLPENSSPGLQILVLTASDKDKDGLSNGYFRTNNTMFTVDKSGVMYFMNGEVDRESTPRIHVQVWVFDALSGGLNSSAEVIINITDVNDNNPEFQNLPLHYTIPEGDYTNSTTLLVATINVTDLDTGLNGNVTVSAEDGDENFQVQENGKIFVKGPVDRETKDKYVMFLVASDKGNPPRKSFAEATIDVEDINDNPPTFTKQEYSVDLILDKVKAGDIIMSVSATDLDIGNNSLISYRFAEPRSEFSINDGTGDIYLTSDAFAVTMGTDIVLPVIATDHGVPALSSMATVIIKVSKLPTEFVNSSYNFSLLEGMPQGSDVGSVEVTTAPRVSVRYFLQTYTKVFSITDNGTIITRIRLDREEQDSYNILLEAVDSQDPPNTGVTMVTVTVMDVNDNIPVFQPFLNRNVTCLENQNFLHLANVAASDGDIGENSVITYSLEDDYGGTFYMNSSTGHLFNIKPLDAEKMDSYDLKVIAQDSGMPPLSSTATIHVTVQDVDDNSPSFRNTQYRITIKENEPPHLILNISAVDMDTGPNAVILYSFIKDYDLFYIGEESGSIFSLKPLDFEARSEYLLTAIAYSPRIHHPQSAATIIVHVEDVNEEGPVVEYPVYHKVIWDGEYTTGSIILDVNAQKGKKNIDEGIHYCISGDNSEKLFSIANGTGHIFLTKDLPNHSFPEYYVFTVTCTDSGEPPQSTSVKVYVVISPNHVALPIFSAEYYKPESLNTWTVPYTYIIQIKAFYLHATIVYSIAAENNKDYFIVDPLSGVIRTKKILRMEDFPCNITVKATDSKRSWIYSEAVVHVIVTRGNQHAPVFPNSLEKVTVKEGQQVPTVITQVEATDKDPGRDGILTYSILNNPPHPFTIDPTNGTVFADIPFDFENGSREFQVFICAEDYGIPHKKQGYLTLIVRILDINDWAPVFSPHVPIYVKESAPPGTVVGQITATDGDSGDNSFIVYSLFDDSDQFTIDRLLGNIFIKRHLDHELRKKSLLTITASNNRTAPFYQTRTNLTVYILDENDNAPQFTQKNYFAELDVNSAVGSCVIALNATDRDEGNNGVVEYSLLPDFSFNYFIFENLTNGRLLTATNHLKPGKFTLSVVAKDRGSPSLSNMATVIVNLISRNQILPEFSPNEISTVLEENKPNKDPVFIFSAKKATGKNVTYRIVGGNDRGQFHLDEKTGKLWATEKVNEEPSYDIIVEADSPPNTHGPLPPNMAELRITVPNFREGPKFEKKSYAATIANTVPPGFPVIKVTATSKGSISQQSLIYSLVNQSGAEFDIDKNTGQILVSHVARKTGTFHFQAQVTDKKGLSAQTQVEIQVDSPSDDIVEMKINQTLDEVEPLIPKIIRVLEDVLLGKVTVTSLDSSNKSDTDIKFEVDNENYQEVVRKLRDNMSALQTQLDSIFGKPVLLTIPQLPFGLSQTVMAVIGAFIVFLMIVIVSAACFLLRKTPQTGFTKPSSVFIDKKLSAIVSDGPARNVLIKNDGDNTAKNEADKDGGSKDPAPNNQNQGGEHIVEEENKRDETPNIEDDQDGGCDFESTVGDERLEDFTDIEIKSRTKAPTDLEEQQMDDTVTDTPVGTEQDTLPCNRDETRNIEDDQDGGCDYGSPSEDDKHEDDIEIKSRTIAPTDFEEQQMDDTVTDTPEDTEKDTLLCNSESETSIRLVSEGEVIKEEETLIIEEKEVEYVETWESYESTEDSDVESPKNSVTKSETEKSPVTGSEKPKSDGEETITVTFLEDE